ncbi:beta-ketoacyl synthase chain length factor [Accumulibacter sp.]|uniref:beta-ketoacyl synthase chain length factor n=1 Tax=Accumulibacter sp. TaxID=2053492 RepID=UPI00260FC5CB|nr:beta-ketoacyl synthase chain length factor [Accumulibacter sp.]
MRPAPLGAWIEGIGCLAPGLPDWPTACAVLCGEQAYAPAPTRLPVPSLLPAAERRRASRVVRLALALGLEAAAQAGAELTTLATVFTASGADGHNCHALCEQLASDDRRVSPTRFHNSVHNAAAGYWGIATGSMAPCQVLCAFDASFGAGLLEALAQVVAEQRPVLLIAYDSEYPEPLHSKRPIGDCAGVALLLTPDRSALSLARLALAPSDDVAAKLADDRLEHLRTTIPALRALPLLQSLARRKTDSVCLDYLPPMSLRVDLDPC